MSQAVFVSTIQQVEAPCQFWSCQSNELLPQPIELTLDVLFKVGGGVNPTDAPKNTW
jgi:hypothetical protein